MGKAKPPPGRATGALGSSQRYGVTGVVTVPRLLAGTLSSSAALTESSWVNGFASALILTVTNANAPGANVPKRHTLTAALLQVPWLGVREIAVPLEMTSVKETLLALEGPLLRTIKI